MPTEKPQDVKDKIVTKEREVIAALPEEEKDHEELVHRVDEFAERIIAEESLTDAQKVDKLNGLLYILCGFSIPVPDAVDSAVNDLDIRLKALDAELGVATSGSEAAGEGSTTYTFTVGDSLSNIVLSGLDQELRVNFKENSAKAFAFIRVLNDYLGSLAVPPNLNRDPNQEITDAEVKLVNKAALNAKLNAVKDVDIAGSLDWYADQTSTKAHPEWVAGLRGERRTGGGGVPRNPSEPSYYSGEVIAETVDTLPAWKVLKFDQAVKAGILDPDGQGIIGGKEMKWGLFKADGSNDYNAAIKLPDGKIRDASVVPNGVAMDAAAAKQLGIITDDAGTIMQGFAYTDAAKTFVEKVAVPEAKASFIQVFGLDGSSPVQRLNSSVENFAGMMKFGQMISISDAKTIGIMTGETVPVGWGRLDDKLVKLTGEGADKNKLPAGCVVGGVDAERLGIIKTLNLAKPDITSTGWDWVDGSPSSNEWSVKKVSDARVADGVSSPPPRAGETIVIQQEAPVGDVAVLPGVPTESLSASETSMISTRVKQYIDACEVRPGIDYENSPFQLENGWVIFHGKNSTSGIINDRIIQSTSQSLTDAFNREWVRQVGAKMKEIAEKQKNDLNAFVVSTVDHFANYDAETDSPFVITSESSEYLGSYEIIKFDEDFGWNDPVITDLDLSSQFGPDITLGELAGLLNKKWVEKKYPANV
ncbi:MAG: hypothetical protein WCT46_03100 [Candidatus Gracilibacteria bacterium]